MNKPLRREHWTTFRLGLTRDMQDLVVGVAAKVMLTSLAFKGAKEALPELRKEFAPAYNVVARILSDLTRKRIDPDTLRHLHFQMNPRDGQIVIRCEIVKADSVKPISIECYNEHVEPHLQALRRKEHVLAAGGDTLGLLTDLYATL
jgi:hypothetical protein